MATRVQLSLNYEVDVEAELRRRHPDMVDFRILTQSLDARGANRGKHPRFNYVIEIIKSGEKFTPFEEVFPKLGALESRPLIIGAGPAGLFCALRLMEYGIPSLIVERGDQAHRRMKTISRHWRYGEFDEDNNVCYGEGGAGLFSDGKLITRIKSPHVSYVMQRFVDFGAPPETAWMSNPHLGSNKIRQLIGKLTAHLMNGGCEIRYNTRVEKILFKNGKTVGVELAGGEKVESQHVVLATGHSAKEMYHHLKSCNVAMQAKDFAIGVRVEHPRELIDMLQYGHFAGDPVLGTARYQLKWQDPNSQKGSYSFCMCPGGYVLSSGTDADGIVVNGMSNYARNSRWSNSALVVTVRAGEDYSTKDILGGLEFQRQIEHEAWQQSKERATGKEVPVQTLKQFLNNSETGNLPKTSCPSGIFEGNLQKILPEFVTGHLQKALLKFDERMKGFISDQALLLAPETRTSSPLTILRDKLTLESTSHVGLYPCGEGAGHAGGITSAAVDGIKVAMCLIKKEKGYEA